MKPFFLSFSTPVVAQTGGWLAPPKSGGKPTFFQSPHSVSEKKQAVRRMGWDQWLPPALSTEEFLPILASQASPRLGLGMIKNS